MKKKIGIIIIALILIVVAAISYDISYQQQVQQSAPQVAQPKTPTISYKGQNGKNALQLLKQSTTVEQDHSGLVTAINGYKPTGHNYWAFYVNGKYSSVGPASFKTKNSDVITWKVEKY